MEKQKTQKTIDRGNTFLITHRKPKTKNPFSQTGSLWRKCERERQKENERKVQRAKREEWKGRTNDHFQDQETKNKGERGSTHKKES